MATAQEVMRIVAARTGIDYGRVRNIARREIETEVWPSSSGRSIPELEPKHIVQLLIALATNVEAKLAGSVSRHYFELPLTGDDKIAAKTAGEMLTQMLASFLGRTNLLFSKWAFQSRIEINDTNAPAISVVTPTTDGRPVTIRYADDDSLPAFRRYTILTGELLFNIAKDISLADA